jgi:hypothetical protein
MVKSHVQKFQSLSSARLSIVLEAQSKYIDPPQNLLDVPVCVAFQLLVTDFADVDESANARGEPMLSHLNKSLV